MSKIILYILIHFLTIINIYYAQELKIEIELDKAEYIVGEPIFCQIRVINNNSYNVQIENFESNQTKSFFGFYPNIVAKNNKLTKVSDRMLISHYFPMNYIIQSGDTAYYNVDLTYEYTNNSIRFENRLLSIFMQDTYTLQYELLNYFDNNKETTLYLSNKVNFKIIEANQKEEILLANYSKNKYNSDELINLVKVDPDSKLRILIEKQILNNYFHKENGAYLITEYLSKNASTKLIKMLHVGVHKYHVSDYMKYDSFQNAVKSVELDSFVSKNIDFIEELNLQAKERNKEKKIILPVRDKQNEK